MTIRSAQTLIFSKLSVSNPPVRGLLSTSVMLIAARVAGLGASFGGQILVARLLAPEGLGIFYFATSIAYVVSMVAAFGYPAIAVRFISRYRMRANGALMAAFVNRAQRDTALVAFAAMAVVLMLAVIIPGDVTTRLAVGAAALGIPACALSRIYASVALAIRQFALSYVLNLLWRPLLFLFLMGLAAILFSAPSPVMAASAFSFVAVIIVTLQFVGLIRHFPSMADLVPSDRRIAYQWRLASAPLLILAAFSTLISDLNLALLGAIIPKSDVAVLGVCLKLAILVDYVVSLIHEIVAPDISDALARKQTSLIEIAVARANIAAIAATVGATVGVALFGQYILAAFGPDFVRAYPILLTLVATQVIRAAFGPSVLTLISAGAQKSVVIVFAITIVTSALGNLVFVPIFGLAGAAAVFTVMTVYWTASLALALKRNAIPRVDIAASFGVLRRTLMNFGSLIGGVATTSTSVHPRNGGYIHAKD
jgi:O-antigen/teichoic acid export membrane protein